MTLQNNKIKLATVCHNQWAVGFSDFDFFEKIEQSETAIDAKLNSKAHF
jgi:hypothetical protein